MIENAIPSLSLIRLGPTIRILGMINRLEPRVRTFCQIWFQGSHQPVISKVLEYKYIWFKKWGNYKHGIFQPYMLACQGRWSIYTWGLGFPQNKRALAL